MPPSAPPPDLARQAWTAMRAYVEDNARSGTVQDVLGLGVGSGRVKALLRLRGGPLTLGQLAAAHGVDAPYATIIVDTLESLGLVERTPHPDDRRRKLVTLTGAGWAAAATAEEILQTPPPGLAALAPEQLSALVDVLAGLG